MLLEPVWFMLFSNLEAFSWCALCMSIFRYKTSEYAWQILVVVTLMNLQSFILRNELSLSYLAPIINIIFVTFLFATIVKVSLVGSLTITIVGFVGFGIVQAIITVVIFGTISEAQSTAFNGYFLQAATAGIVFIISWFLYRYGYGFSYDFERFRFQYERTVTISLLFIFIVSITAVLYLNEIWAVIAVFIVSLIFFLKYAIKKEKDI